MLLHLLVLLAAAVGPVDRQRAELLCHTGRNALEEKRLKDASAAFEKALAAWPDMPDAHVGLGHVSLRRGEYESALVEYRAARAAYLALAEGGLDDANRRFEDAQRAIEQRQEEIQQLHDPKHGVDQQYIDARERELNEQIDALRRIQRPMAAPGSNVPAELDFFIGNALWRLQRGDEAIAAWETAVREDPSYGPVYNNLAVAWWTKGQVDHALAAVAEAEKHGVKVDDRFKKELARK